LPQLGENIVRIHTSISLPVLALAFAIASPIPAGLAQTAAPSDQDHSAHHPASAPTSAPSDKAPMGMMGKDKGDMMGKAGGAGMMGGDMKEMMSMMRNMMTMMSAHSGMMASNVEGRIAGLKTELKISDAQAPQWNRFADALRGAGKTMNGMSEQTMSSGMTMTLPSRFDQQQQMLSTHLNSLKTLKEALDPLYASFSDDQKKTADGLMIGPMGMM
jgi:hypothetical protein